MIILFGILCVTTALTQSESGIIQKGDRLEMVFTSDLDEDDLNQITKELA